MMDFPEPVIAMAVEPKTRSMFEAIGRMAEVLAAAERDCGNEGE